MKLDMNPLLAPWEGPYGLPPFGSIHASHFRPAFEAAMREHDAEIEAIAASSEPATFDNTIAAFDGCGRLLARIDALFQNLGSSATTPELQAVEMEMAAPLAAHENALRMHAGLFARIDAVFESREQLGLNAEQKRLVERIHLDFTRAGARLADSQRGAYGQMVERHAELMTRFAQNVLADESSWQLVLRGEAELVGLPGFVRATARQAAIEREVLEEGACVITLSRSLIVPFLTFSERRDLRELAWRAWTSRGEHPGEHDNRPVAREILALRQAQAHAHGYASYADYAVRDSMAGDQAAVRGLLEQVWAPAKRRAAEELDALNALVAARGEHQAVGELQAWDWRYYAEKVRLARYDLDEALLKPYFPLPAMVQAAFDVAGRLFGLRFVHQPQLATYHPDVQAYEVRDAGGRVLGLFLQDNFARPSKRSGAWMSHLRWQSNGGPNGAVLPVILNNNNFARGTAGQPSLLSFDDARTLFHEFGHGLHGLLSNVTYDRLSGTQVLRDFVELPSQLYEHWLMVPEVLKQHARHVETGEPIPDALVARIQAAEKFNQGYETVRYTASALVDLAVHAQAGDDGVDITAFERAELARLGAPAVCGMNHRLPHFQHLFSGTGYAAGYYVYLWAEVLDADAFEAFKEAGNAFDPALAQRLRRHVYGAGNSVEPGAAYRAFRGQDATVEPMLRGRGLLEGEAA